MEEWISEIEDQLNEIKWEGKTREKRVKGSEHSHQEIWVYVKKQIYIDMVYLNVMGRIKPSGKTFFRLLSRRLSQPSKAGQHSNSENTENTMKIFLKKSNPKAHNHQIHQGWNEGKNAKGNQRERSGYSQKEAHQTNSDPLQKYH